MTGFAFAYAVVRVCGGQPRKNLGEPMGDAAKGKVEHYWRNGTHDALEELRTKELYGKKYSKGVSI